MTEQPQEPLGNAATTQETGDLPDPATTLATVDKDAEIASLTAQRDVAVALLRSARSTALALAAQIDRALG